MKIDNHELLYYTSNTEQRSIIFLAADHPAIADLLFYSLGTIYHITQSQHRAHDLYWLDQLVTCSPRPAAVILEVDCLWTHEWTAFTQKLGQAWKQWELTLPLILINDYHGNGGNGQWLCIRKPFSIEGLRSLLAHMLTQPDDQPIYHPLPLLCSLLTHQRSAV